MSKNMDMTRNGNIVVPLTVPAGTVAGEVVFIGTDGLMGYALTAIQPAPDVLSEESYVHGLEEDQASVELVGVNLVVRVAVVEAVAEGEGIYLSAQNTYTTTAGTDPLIGWAIADTTSAGDVARVALRASS